MPKWNIIAISGCTNGGKTTLSKRLEACFPGSVIFNQDIFFRQDNDPNHVWIQLSNGIRHQNWDQLSSINWEAFTMEIQKVLETQAPTENCLLIVEGHLVLNYDGFPFQFERKYFLTLDEDECWNRRQTRTYIPNDPPRYFQECVWPMYVQHKEKMLKLHKDVIMLSGTLPQEEIFNYVVNDLKRLNVVPNKNSDLVKNIGRVNGI